MSTEEQKRPPGRPPKQEPPAPIPDTFEHVVKSIVSAPPAKEKDDRKSD